MCLKVARRPSAWLPVGPAARRTTPIGPFHKNHAAGSAAKLERGPARRWKSFTESQNTFHTWACVSQAAAIGRPGGRAVRLAPGRRSSVWPARRNGRRRGLAPVTIVLRNGNCNGTPLEAGRHAGQSAAPAHPTGELRRAAPAPLFSASEA